MFQTKNLPNDDAELIVDPDVLLKLIQLVSMINNQAILRAFLPYH